MPKSKMQALARDIEPNSILEDDVMELLHRLAEDFVENVVSGSCALAKHRRCTTLGNKTLQLLMH
jgi:transcription initiation factor TFIID subunit 12